MVVSARLKERLFHDIFRIFPGPAKAVGESEEAVAMFDNRRFQLSKTFTVPV